MKRALLKLAYENPDMRPHLLPLIKRGSTTPVGKTDENESIRWHRYAPSTRVWDLTNAGRRGKIVDVFSLYGYDWRGGPEAAERVDEFVGNLPKMDFQQALKAARELEKDGIGRVETSHEKGILVDPPGFKSFTMEALGFTLSMHPRDGYSVLDKSDLDNMPACYNRGKSDVKRFYRWVQENMHKIRRMSYQELLRAMSQEDFDFHSYCRMD